jgi:hypothetical protein
MFHDGRLPDGWKCGIKDKYLFAHDIPLLFKEIVLHANKKGTKRLGDFDDFIKLINAIRKFQDNASGKRVTEENIWLEMHRIGHQQFQVQKQITLPFMMRYIKVFGEDEVNKQLFQTTGLGIKDFIILGMAISGHLMKHSGINIESCFTALEKSVGITPEQVKKFLSITSSTVDELMAEIKNHAIYDEFWVYSWNPVERKPLVVLDDQHPHRLHCPVPNLFIRRISQGLFYEFGEKLDANKYGKSFEKYIGEIISQIFPSEKYARRESIFYVDKNKNDGADFILAENDALLFIECKTKRMTLKAKFAKSESDEDFIKDVSIIADAIVQNYKNIEGAKKHALKDEEKGLPMFPLVITLENWTIFSLSTKTKINEAVKEKLSDVGIKESILSEMPYTVISSEEFEIVSNVIQQVGICEFFSKKTSEQYADMEIYRFCFACFPSAKQTNLQELFKDDWKRTLPEEIAWPPPS